MRYEISEDHDEVVMTVTDVGVGAARLMESLQECQQGQCACPTDQYDRLDAIDVQAGDDDFTVRLRPRTGEVLDVQALHACMDYTVNRADAD